MREGDLVRPKHGHLYEPVGALTLKGVTLASSAITTPVSPDRTRPCQLCVCVYVYVSAVCVSVCMRESELVCVCVCVWECVYI
jgi:hypothetical protein